jgi:tetratricopeptide (TPR) repeat protein
MARVTSLKAGVAFSMILLCGWMISGTARGAEPEGVTGLPAGQATSPQLLLEQAYKHADANEYQRGLDVIITALESHPDSAWDRKDYWNAVVKGFEWFARLPDAERERMMGKYGKPKTGSGKTEAPLFNQMTNWMHDLLPGTPLKSPGGKLVLGTWHWQSGNYTTAVAYALGVLQARPNSLAGQTALTALIGAQYYGCDKTGALRTIRLGAKLAPNTPTTAWAICRGVLHLCAQNDVETAKGLCTEILQASTGTLAGSVAGQMYDLIGEIEGMAYKDALERMWRLRDYAVPGPASDVLRTLTMGIDPMKHPRDLEAQERIESITYAAQDEIDTGKDPLRRACAFLILGYCANVKGETRKAVEFYQTAVDTGQEGTEEYALAEMGRILFSMDVKRATEVLERFRKNHGGSAGSEPLHELLGMCYQRQGRYAEALKIFQDLESHCNRGQAMVDVRGDRLTARMAGCLRGLGRHEEAERLAARILERHSFGAAPDKLGGEELGELFGLLKEMERTDEANRLEQEMFRRAAQTRAKAERQ